MGFQGEAWRRWAALAPLALLAAAPAEAEEPFRLHAALDAPAWLKLEGETRLRYEALDGQFRAGGAGGDQLLAARTLLLAEADGGPVAVGLELQDSRGALDDSGTPLSTSIINPLDVLQAYLRFDLDGAFGTKAASLKLGRQTLDIGSRRVIERVDMANAIFSYTGAYWRSVSQGGDEFHAVAFVPVGRQPADRDSLGEDQLSADEEQWGRFGWGVHYRAADVLGAAAPDIWAEAYVYGLQERDTRANPTPNRDYVQPGFRIYRAPKAGRWDLEIEAARRTGSRRATSSAADEADLDVSAAFATATLGYTFDHPWRPRAALDHYYASGDEDPTDGRFDQFERLFGSRRTDLGNTGIHGPLTPANLSAPGARVEIAPGKRFDARLAYKAAYLAEARDQWVIARVQDRSGQSGRFIGHTLDARVRAWLRPDSLRLEIGASALITGRFAEEAPNAARQGDTLFGYIQATQSF